MEKSFLCSGTGHLVFGTLGVFSLKAGWTPTFLQTSPDGASRLALLKACGSVPVSILGISEGQTVQETHWVPMSADRVHGLDELGKFNARAIEPDMEFVLSNKGEASYTFGDGESLADNVPKSFPAQMLRMLHNRFLATDGAPITVAPLELIPDNGTKLQETVLKFARQCQFRDSDPFVCYLREVVRWRKTLIDRICPQNIRRDLSLSLPGVFEHPYPVWAEPFACLAIQHLPGDPKFIENEYIHYVADVGPYELRKVRILNGLHTAMVIASIAHDQYRSTVSYVREVMEIPYFTDLIMALGDELCELLKDRVVDAKGFLRDVLDRFRNPIFNHELKGIAWNHLSKVEIRLAPSVTDAAQAGLKLPALDWILELHRQNLKAGRYEPKT